ncbi:hypothetical protein QUC31_010852 [Theobroma cacao]|uniref:Hydroxyproline-rich glycoprotein family protein, putative n=1 Tax=Theobroma cacao TaxID=3641 RepID=A0A061EUW1_THECC|nr:Hydroxyproline-rich glycoprotein family protein, putative [Theobroma cacao]
MSSHSEDHQNKRDQPNHHSSPSSDTNNNHQPAAPPPSQPPPPPQPPNNQSPAHGYPPAMRFPPQMVYTHGGPYPAYPPPPHGCNQYPYAQLPPGAPYYNQGYASPQNDRCSGFARGIIAAMFVLIVLTCLSSLITWVVLRPEIPVFHVDNMSVSNFNTSTPFMATWDTNLTLENPNHKLRLYLDKIVGAMFYDDEDSLGSSWLNPIFMETKTKTTMNAIISTNGSAQNAVPIWLTQEMSKDRATGSLTFALRIRIWATFKTGSWWTRSLVIRVLCDDLKVNFVGASGNGALAPGKRDNCDVYA